MNAPTVGLLKEISSVGWIVLSLEIPLRCSCWHYRLLSDNEMGRIVGLTEAGSLNNCISNHLGPTVVVWCLQQWIIERKANRLKITNESKSRALLTAAMFASKTLLITI